MQIFFAVAMAIASAVVASSSGNPATGFVWPITPPHTVVRAFEAPPHPWSAGHRGVDLAAAAGAVVAAAGPGVVTFSAVIAGRGVVTVRHPDGRRTTYEPVEDRIPAGSPVMAGTPLGRLSAQGSHCAPRTCLHWGLLVNVDEYRDPLSLLGVGPIVLLPLGVSHSQPRGPPIVVSRRLDAAARAMPCTLAAPSIAAASPGRSRRPWRNAGADDPGCGRPRG